MKKRAAFSCLAALVALTGGLTYLGPAGTAAATTRAAVAEIASAHATKASLGPAGGTLQVKATVKHAQQCQLDLLWVPEVHVVYSHNPTTSCHGDNYSANVTVGPNQTGTARTVALHLVARNPTSSAATTIYVTVSAVPAKTTTTTTTVATTTTSTTVPGPAPTSSTTTTSTVPGLAAVAISGPLSNVDSANWSGFTVYGGPFTAVQGTFTVPNVTASLSNADTSEWVGVDGANDQSLIQAGVIEEVGPQTGGGIAIDPWWEVLPAAATPISSMQVAAGDSLTVTISQLTGTSWQISLVDNTNGQSFSTQQAYNGPGQSAEWILEAPTDAQDNQIATLAPFSPAVTFSGLATGGVVTSLEDDTLVQGGSVIATPSSITSGGFSVANTDTPAPARALPARRTGPTTSAATDARSFNEG